MKRILTDGTDFLWFRIERTRTVLCQVKNEKEAAHLSGLFFLWSIRLE